MTLNNDRKYLKFKHFFKYMTVLTGTHENKAILMVSVLEGKKTSYFFQRAV